MAMLDNPLYGRQLCQHPVEGQEWYNGCISGSKTWVPNLPNTQSAPKLPTEYKLGNIL